MKKLQQKLANLLDSIAKSLIRLSIRLRYFCFPPEASTLAEFWEWKRKHPMKHWYYKTFIKPLK